MKKLVICVVLGIIAFGLVACARSAEYEWAPQVSMYSMESMRTELGLNQPAIFDLPLTGGGGLFNRTQRMAVTTADYAVYDWHAEPAPQMPQYEDLEWSDIAGTGERHVIQTAIVELATEYFDDVVEQLRNLAPSVNGFVASSMTTAHGRRMFTIVMRVPVASFEAALGQVEAMAYVRVLNQWAQDVTDQFYDMISSYEIRRLEEERILALIEQTENVQELLALEQRLASTRLSIEMYLSQLNNMAGQIAYSTIEVTLSDIAEVPIIILDPTLGERVSGAFGDSIDGTVRFAQGFVVFMAGAIVPLALVGVAAAVIYIAVRVKTRKNEPSSL